MESVNRSDVVSPSPERAKSSKPARGARGRGRARIDLDVRARPTRVGRRAPDRPSLAIDDLYLSEMAERTVLSVEQEIAIGQAIANAERSILERLLDAPTGQRSLVELAASLTDKTKDIRDVLLNPDQEGLDLEAVSARVAGAMALAENVQEGTRHELVDTLSAARLDAKVLDSIVERVKECVQKDGDARDAAALAGIRRAQRELKQSKEQLVVGNLRLVVLFARKYLGRGIPLLDLVQEGNLGLMRAADKFDHRRGFRFSTYAAWWIKQALQRALLDRTVRLPVHVADDRRRVGKVRAAFSAQHLREPTAEEIAERSGLAKERIQTILTLPAQPSSLDVPVGEDGDARIVDLVPSSAELPDQAAALHALQGQLEGLMDALSTREQQVLRMRFGIGFPREHTLEEVGKELALTRERIRQIERAALEKLRAKSDRVELRSYLGG